MRLLFARGARLRARGMLQIFAKGASLTMDRKVPPKRAGSHADRDADQSIDRAWPVMPHERDEHHNPGDTGERVASGPRAVMDQAATDVRRGLLDSEWRGAPSDIPVRG